MIAEAKVLPIQQEIDWAYIEKNFAEHLPSYVILKFVNRDDDLDNNTKEVANAIEKNSLYDLELTALDDWYLEQSWYYEDEYWSEFKKKVLEELDDAYNDLDEPYGEEGDNISRIREYVDTDHDGCYESFREWLWEHDDSGDILQDLIRNSSDPGMFYDLNLGYGETWNWPDSEYGTAIKEICDILSLDYHSKPVRDQLFELLANASGGGYLRIYFNASLLDMISGDKDGCKYNNDGTDFKAIRFNGTYWVALYNPGEGSGHWVDLKLDCSFQFNRENLRLSETEHYCLEKCFGTYQNYGSDDVEFLFEEPKTEVQVNTSLIEETARQAEYDRVYKAGGCTFGDIDFKRHRNVEYKNIPPFAGHYCPHCGMYWAD